MIWLVSSGVGNVEFKIRLGLLPHLHQERSAFSRILIAILANTRSFEFSDIGAIPDRSLVLLALRIPFVSVIERKLECSASQRVESSARLSA